LHEEAFVRVSVLRAANRVDYWIDNSGTPSGHRSHHMHKRILGLVVENINDHQRQEANNEAQKNHQHHDRQPQIIFVAEKLQLAFRSRRRVKLIQFRVLFSHSVENAGIRKDDDETR
jgi:hypothetical protein